MLYSSNEGDELQLLLPSRYMYLEVVPLDYQARTLHRRLAAPGAMLYEAGS